MSSGSVVANIPVITENLNHINILFNFCLKQNPFDNVNYSPAFKLGFINGGQNVFDRMFTVEERNGIIFFVKSVPPSGEENNTRRSVYAISQKKTLYIHYKRSVLFKDLFDYCHLEPDEVANFLIFLSEGTYYNSIAEISSKNPSGYKETTKILTREKGIEVGNDMLIYSLYLGIESQKKVGYYIPEQNNGYLHVTLFLGKEFGLVDNPRSFFGELANDSNKILTVANTVFLDPRQYTQPQLTKTGKIKKQPKKNPYIGLSLVNKLVEDETIQYKRFTIGWFLCEILYPFFYFDAW